MTRRVASGPPASVADRVEAFRARAAEVRPHPLFQQEVYEFSCGFVMDEDGAVRYHFPKADRAQQHYFASLLRPFLSENDLISLNRCFGVFGAALDDPGLRQGLGEIHADYRTARRGSMFSAEVWSVDGSPPERSYTDWEIACAALYGDLLHTDAEPRRLLRGLVPPGGSRWDHQALMMMFHVTGRTALRVDDLLQMAQDRARCRSSSGSASCLPSGLGVRSGALGLRSGRDRRVPLVEPGPAPRRAAAGRRAVPGAAA